MATAPIAKINTQVLRGILEPIYVESIGALPMPEAVSFIAREIEGQLPEMIEKSLTKAAINRMHQKFRTEELPKLTRPEAPNAATTPGVPARKERANA